ncbi:hypothetical protein ACN6AT_37490 (plasmid) [Streptomyces sp. JL4002]|uniref:hypothetical protein n=1 Tax=Streptomyces sp. JL4002 TaxID=3404781 RepID=UPI003B27B994
MAHQEYVGHRLIEVSVLPARVVYLIAEGSTSGFRAAVRTASHRWGGMTEPIIEVGSEGDGGNIARLVAVADVQAVVNVDADPSRASVLAASWRLPLVAIDDMESASPMGIGIHEGKVLAGEVKVKAAEFSKNNQIARDVELSRRLGADIHLMAATDVIDDALQDEARDRCDRAGLELLVLHEPELRPGLAEQRAVQSRRQKPASTPRPRRENSRTASEPGLEASIDTPS